MFNYPLDPSNSFVVTINCIYNMKTRDMLTSWFQLFLWLTFSPLASQASLARRTMPPEIITKLQAGLNGHPPLVSESFDPVTSMLGFSPGNDNHQRIAGDLWHQMLAQVPDAGSLSPLELIALAKSAHLPATQAANDRVRTSLWELVAGQNREPLDPNFIRKTAISWQPYRLYGSGAAKKIDTLVELSRIARNPFLYHDFIEGILYETNEFWTPPTNPSRWTLMSRTPQQTKGEQRVHSELGHLGLTLTNAQVSNASEVTEFVDAVRLTHNLPPHDKNLSVRFDDRFDGRKGRLVIVRDTAKKVIATAGYQPLAVGVCELILVYVDEKYRGPQNGTRFKIAESLVKMLMIDAHNQGYDTMELTTRAASFWHALKMYFKLRFFPSARQNDPSRVANRMTGPNIEQVDLTSDLWDLDKRFPEMFQDP
jgi:hypothetical protein